MGLLVFLFLLSQSSRFPRHNRALLASRERRNLCTNYYIMAELGSDAIAQGLTETCQKVESSLMPCIQEHLTSSEFSPQHGLDFLESKNSLLLSYLIDLTLLMRNRLMGKEPKDNLHRLVEMRTVLDKMRNLDKRLRYQIDKLLASQTNASSFATSDGATQEDPLQFRPGAMEDDDDEDNEKRDSEDEKSSDSSEVDGDNVDDDDDDDDLASARQTIRMAEAGDKEPKDDDDDAAVYRAPRLAAVPYTHDQEDRQAERDKRQRRRMRASELARVLRHEFGDAPEQQDVHGGSELGQQREAARRLAQREAEKTAFEEDQMVRLTTTRKEKKERLRLMRAEKSNLAAISDLGNLVRDAALGDNEEEASEADQTGIIKSGRHSSGKRIRQAIDRDGRTIHSQGKRRSIQTKNSLQDALFNRESGKSKKKKRNKR